MRYVPVLCGCDRAWLVVGVFPVKRRRLSKAARQRLELEQGGTCCVPGCEETEGLIEEHSVPFAITGAPADQLMCKRHHDEKTYGKPHVKVDGDLSKLAKMKRHRDGKTQADKREKRGFSLIRSAGKLFSRGFDKTKRKRMDGTVEDRK